MAPTDTTTAPPTIIVVGGAPPPAHVGRVLPAAAFVIAADSGYDHAVALSLAVDLLIGDLDSISGEGLSAAAGAEVLIERHSPDKDATDTELAIDAALARGSRRIIAIAGGGDRVDHGLATIAAFSAPRLAGVEVDLWWGTGLIIPVHAGTARTIELPERTVFSLLPMHGDAHVATLTGARYPLRDITLAAGSSRGISNVARVGPIELAMTGGVALLIVPDHPALVDSAASTQVAAISVGGGS